MLTLTCICEIVFPGQVAEQVAEEISGADSGRSRSRRELERRFQSKSRSRFWSSFRSWFCSKFHNIFPPARRRKCFIKTQYAGAARSCRLIKATIDVSGCPVAKVLRKDSSKHGLRQSHHQNSE